MIARQGDVLIERVDEVPPDAKPLNRKTQRVTGRLVLAYGEATGHHHSIALADVDEIVVDDAEAIYMRIMRETPLEHQEHDAISLKPGLYKSFVQVEYTPAEVVRVMD